MTALTGHEYHAHIQLAALHIIGLRRERVVEIEGRNHDSNSR